jgi:DNA-directed RNA polymerase subunit M/transcription elongation factor TFIIS
MTAWFCPKCGTLMISSDGWLKCRKCSYIRKINDKDQMQIKIDCKKNELPVIEQPYTKLPCPHCRNECKTLGVTHRIPNPDPDGIDTGYSIHCDMCGGNWIYHNLVSKFVKIPRGSTVKNKRLKKSHGKRSRKI